jgi:hypothetical protein
LHFARCSTYPHDGTAALRGERAEGGVRAGIAFFSFAAQKPKQTAEHLAAMVATMSTLTAVQKYLLPHL